MREAAPHDVVELKMDNRTSDYIFSDVDWNCWK